MTEKICRLCLQTITENHQTIEESTLKTLKLNSNISRGNVICAECASYLEVVSNLKPTCVRGSILPSIDIKNGLKTDPEYETTSNIKPLIEMRTRCSFCDRISGRESLVSLNDTKRFESLVNLLKQHVPEMNLKNGEELLTCETCLGILRGLFGFLSKCLEVEEKINKYTEIEGTDHKGRIELKDIQQFIFSPTVKFEIASISVNELGERCDQIQEEYPMTAEDEIKYEKETNNPETIIKTEFINIKSEHDSGSFQELFDEYKIADDPLEIPVLPSETTPKDYVEQQICEMCSYRTKCKDTFKQHVLDHKDCLEVNRELCSCKSKTDKNPSVVPMFKCELCSFRTKCEIYIQKHLLTHETSSEAPIFKCDVCSYQTKRKRNLQMHLLTHKTPSEVPMFKCEFCSYGANRKEYVQRHLLTHKTASEVPMFKCELCSYQTKRKEYFPKHLLTHKTPSEVTTFNCELCSYRAKHKRYLRKHLLSHKPNSEVPMFKCELCSYQTKYKRYLKMHSCAHKTPSEVPMLKCEFCSYLAKHKRYLQKHLLTHKSSAEVSLFKCDLCSYCTKYKRNLQAHLLTHKSPSEVPMFKCQYCSYQTKHKTYLPSHLLTHKNPSEVPMFKCDLCSFETKHKRYLSKHLLAHNRLSEVTKQK